MVLGLAEGEEDEDEPFARTGGPVKPWQPACASINPLGVVVAKLTVNKGPMFKELLKSEMCCL